MVGSWALRGVTQLNQAPGLVTCWCSGNGYLSSMVTNNSPKQPVKTGHFVSPKLQPEGKPTALSYLHKESAEAPHPQKVGGKKWGLAWDG